MRTIESKASHQNTIRTIRQYQPTRTKTSKETDQKIKDKKTKENQRQPNCTIVQAGQEGTTHKEGVCPQPKNRCQTCIDGCKKPEIAYCHFERPTETSPRK